MKLVAAVAVMLHLGSAMEIARPLMTGLVPCIGRASIPHMWIEPHRALLVHTAQPDATRYCPLSWGWCPMAVPRQHAMDMVWQAMALLKRLTATLVVAFLRAIDPSTRFPKPKPPPLSILASSVGKEALVENRGRTATIKKTTRSGLFGAKQQPRRRTSISGWDALDKGFF